MRENCSLFPIRDFSVCTVTPKSPFFFGALLGIKEDGKILKVSEIGSQIDTPGIFIAVVINSAKTSAIAERISRDAYERLGECDALQQGLSKRILANALDPLGHGKMREPSAVEGEGRDACYTTVRGDRTAQCTANEALLCRLDQTVSFGVKNGVTVRRLTQSAKMSLYIAFVPGASTACSASGSMPYAVSYGLFSVGA